MKTCSRFLALALPIALTACPAPPPAPDAHNADSAVDALVDQGTIERDVQRADVGPMPAWCALPLGDVPGAITPAGLCVRKFAELGSPRTIAFAPNGDLFVAAPAIGSPGGAIGGPGAIVVLSDDDHDGLAEQHTFLRQFNNDGAIEYLNGVQGMVFGDGAIYFTTPSKIFRVPYTPGMREAAPTSVTQVAAYTPISGERLTHGLAYDPATRTLYTSQSVYSSYACPDIPRAGRILRVESNGQLTVLSEGFRNPMYMRCEGTADACFAAELGDDGNPGAMEKLLRIRAGTNYGYPCCYTTSQPDRRNNNGVYDCAQCAREERAIPLGDTPFGFAWEPGVWPLPFRNSFVVAKHGSFYSSPQYAGAGVFFASINPTTQVPNDDFQPIALGFSPSTVMRRPADVAFAPDGRLFIADDNGSAVYWVAPTALRP
jgi:glucose/arabinose dehydrogenase